MNNLTTRKIVLGMLMTLVLAFSVQGIADALTFKKSRTGDLQTVVLPDDEFTIKFSVEPTSSKDISAQGVTPRRQIAEAGVTENGDSDLDDRTPIDSSGYMLKKITVDGKDKYFRISGNRIVDNSGYLIVETTKTDPTSTAEPPAELEPGDRDKDADGLIKAKPDDPLSDSLQHHYNDEAIRIQVTTTGTGAALTSLERSGTPILFFDSAGAQPSGLPENNTQISLIEETKNRQLDTDLTLSSSITLTGEVAAAGVYTITIWDMTHTNDFPVDDVPNERAFLTFTIYVVPDASPATFDLATGGDGVDRGYDSSLKPIMNFLAS